MYKNRDFCVKIHESVVTERCSRNVFVTLQTGGRILDAPSNEHIALIITHGVSCNVV